MKRGFVALTIIKDSMEKEEKRPIKKWQNQLGMIGPYHLMICQRPLPPLILEGELVRLA